MVIELGITIDESPVHLEKAQAPILMTEVTILIDVSPMHCIK